MSIVRTTAYPSRYADEEWLDEPVAQDETVPGKFYLRFIVKKEPRWYGTEGQRLREMAELIGEVSQGDKLYHRKEKFYSIGEWVLASDPYGGVSVTSGMFDADDAESALKALDTLGIAGYVPDEGVTIFFTPDVYDMKLITNLCNIMSARNELIVQALGLEEEIQIIIDRDLAFGIPLNAFSFEKVEACIYLLRQASTMAAGTGKARMKPCDGSNPKYQMRSWLLRLGFIGDQFARPRRTLLDGLVGDGAFFTGEGKEKAAVKRKSKCLAG